MQTPLFILFAATALAAGSLTSSAQERLANATTWSPPADARVVVDRRTGRVSITMPSETLDRAAREATLNEWRTAPFAGTGPFPAARTEDPTLPTHTLYHPADLRKTPPLPIVLWANGGCFNTSIEFTRFLGELASRGYLVVAVGRNDVPFAAFVPGGAAAAGAPPLSVRGGEVLIAGLDWASKENARKGSKYYRKLDVAKVAAIGQSCGGGQAWSAARDPRITTVVALNSNFPSTKAGTGPQSPPPTDDWTIEKLAIPAAYFIGGPGDAAYAPSIGSYAATPATAKVFKANLPVVGHTGAYRQPNGEWLAAVSGWLDWQLKGDAKAKALFAGAGCGLCSNTQWWYEAKNLD
jgi:dienelactone hydrolase